MLRWVLIVATSYLTLLSRPLQQTPTSVALFVAGYFASNLILSKLIVRTGVSRLIEAAVVLFDTAAICVGLALAANVSSDFFLLYFLVLFLGALTERLELVVGAAVISSIVHLTTVARFVDFAQLMQGGYLMRIPFLLVVALFFGHLVEQQARAREELKAQFLSTVAHDLKNPLGLIQSLAELLLNSNAGPLNKGQMSLVRRIHANVTRIITLSLNLLEAGRIEDGGLTAHRLPANLSEVVAEAVALARSASELKGVTLQFATESDLPLLPIDIVQVERVIVNLLDNAIRHTPAGGSIELSVESVADGIALIVRDNGTGIPPAKLPTLFDKYHESQDGAGLGLFIVKKIMEAHGGFVAVDSALGRGTTVVLRFPVPLAA